MGLDANAATQAMKAEVAEKTLAMQEELPGMFEVMVEQVKDFLASENMASLKEMRQLYQVRYQCGSAHACLSACLLCLLCSRCICMV